MFASPKVKLFMQPYSSIPDEPTSTYFAPYQRKPDTHTQRATIQAELCVPKEALNSIGLKGLRQIVHLGCGGSIEGLEDDVSHALAGQDVAANHRCFCRWTQNGIWWDTHGDRLQAAL